MKPFYWLILLLGAVIVALAAFFILARPAAECRYLPADKTLYIISTRDRSISLEIRDVEPHLIHWRSGSALSLKEQAEILDQLLGYLPKQGDYRVFFIGRLEQAFGHDRTLSQRLKAAAAKRPMLSGRENFYVTTVANDAPIYPEIIAAFGHHGYRIKISAVEIVLIDPADHLPYDAMTWFRLEKK